MPFEPPQQAEASKEIDPQARAPRKARGTAKRLVLQSAEYYLESGTHNPTGKVPSAAQLAALCQLVSDESAKTRNEEAAFYGILDRCVEQKFADGIYSQSPLGAVDEYAGLYMSQITARKPGVGLVTHNIEVRIGEFAEFDVAYNDRVAGLAERETAISQLINGW